MSTTGFFSPSLINTDVSKHQVIQKGSKSRVCALVRSFRPASTTVYVMCVVCLSGVCMYKWASWVAQWVKNLPAMQEMEETQETQV